MALVPLTAQVLAGGEGLGVLLCDAHFSWCFLAAIWLKR